MFLWLNKQGPPYVSSFGNHPLLQQGKPELPSILTRGKILFCCEEKPELAISSIFHKLEQGLQIVDEDSVNPTTFFPAPSPCENALLQGQERKPSHSTTTLKKN